MTLAKKFSTALLLASAAGLAGCTGAVSSTATPEAYAAAGFNSTPDIFNGECIVSGIARSGRYNSMVYDFKRGFLGLEHSNSDASYTVAFNAISSPPARAEVMAAYRLLPHEDNCPLPQFPAPAAPTRPSTTN